MAELPEIEAFRISLASLESEALPILEEIATHTKQARKAMGSETEIVDTLTLSNKLVELAILLQRLGDRISMMGYIVRGAKEFYERTREGHKVDMVKAGNPAGVADSKKIMMAHEEFEIYNQCEYTMDRLVYSRKSTDKTIDAIRSKLSYEKVNEQRA